MSSQSNESPARGGDALLGLMAFAVLAASAAIAGLGVLGSWWLLPMALLVVIGLAIAVAYALVHLMDEHDLRAPQLPEREPAPRAEPARLPRPVVGH